MQPEGVHIAMLCVTVYEVSDQEMVVKRLANEIDIVT